MGSNLANGDLNAIRVLKRVNNAGKEYYAILESFSGSHRNVTFLSARWGKYAFSEIDALNLYRGHSVKCVIEDGNKVESFFITAVGSKGMACNTGEGIEGQYRMILLPIFLCYDKEKRELDGYVCQKIYFPKRIFTLANPYIINEKQVAVLAYFGKMIDKRNNVFISIQEFEKVKASVFKKENLCIVNFNVYQNGENISYRNAKQIKIK